MCFSLKTYSRAPGPSYLPTGLRVQGINQPRVENSIFSFAAADSQRRIPTRGSKILFIICRVLNLQTRRAGCRIRSYTWMGGPSATLNPTPHFVQGSTVLSYFHPLLLECLLFASRHYFVLKYSLHIISWATFWIATGTVHFGNSST